MGLEAPKDKSKIPSGRYCYTTASKKRVICPYWSSKDDLPEQENGYCSYLGKSDWDLNEEWDKEGRIVVYRGGKGIALQGGTCHTLSMSLLWDQCKECGVKLSPLAAS